MTTEDSSGTARQRSGPLRVVIESLVLIVVAIVLALIVKTFFAQAFYIPSVSMEPGLRIDDRILVEKPSYWFGGSPQRGDVIVFEDPGGWLSADADTEPPGGLASALAKIGLYPTGGHLVKRVIAVGGDRVVCCDRQGRLTVNGVPLDEEDYIMPGTACAGPMRQDEGGFRGGCLGWRTEVPEGRYFVMGDNRADSADSSFHLCSPRTRREARHDPAKAEQCRDAFVSEDLVVGRVIALIWPFSHFEILHRPDTFEDVPDAP